MSEHDINSPSVMFRRILCRASAIEEFGKPDTHRHAGDRGRIMHAAAAHRLLPEVHRPPPEALTQDEDRIVADYVATVLRMRPSPDAILLVEHRVDLAPIGIPRGGTLDAAWLVPGIEAIIFDLKTGHAYVERPRHNPQAWCYTWGAWDAFGVPLVRCAIFQPAASDDYREDLFDEAEIVRLGDMMRRVADETRSPSAIHTPGEKQCENCKAKATCRPRNAAVAATTQYAKLSNAEAVRAMTPAERGLWWGLIGQAKARIAEIEALFETTVLGERLPIEGYRHGEGRRGHRKWTDDLAALAVGRHLAIEKGKNPNDLEVVKVRSPAEFEKVIGGDAETKRRLAPLITQEPGKPALLQDTRPKVGA